MKSRLRQVLADSHVAAIAVAVLLFAALNGICRGLWDPLYRFLIICAENNGAESWNLKARALIQIYFQNFNDETLGMNRKNPIAWDGLEKLYEESKILQQCLNVIHAFFSYPIFSF